MAPQLAGCGACHRFTITAERIGKGFTMTKDDITKAAALHMLSRGLATLAEIAELSGRSRQIVRHWAREYPNARAEFLAKKWQKALLSAGKKHECG